MCMAVSVAWSAKIGQDFSRYSRPCWSKTVLGCSGSGVSGLASCLLPWSTLSNAIRWRYSAGLLLYSCCCQPGQVFPSLFPILQPLPIYHDISRSSLILILSFRACDNIPVQATTSIIHLGREVDQGNQLDI